MPSRSGSHPKFEIARTKRSLLHGLNLVILCSAFGFLALWRLDLPGLYGDEVGSVFPLLCWREGKILLTMGIHGITESILMCPFFLALGETEAALRIAPFVYSLISIPLFYALIYKLYGRALWAFLAAWLFFTSPNFVIATKTGAHNGVAMFPFLIGGALLFQKWRTADRPLTLLGFAAAAGLALGTRSWLWAFLAAGAVTLATLRVGPSLRERLGTSLKRGYAVLALSMMVLLSGLPFMFNHIQYALRSEKFAMPRESLVSSASKYFEDLDEHAAQTAYQASAGSGLRTRNPTAQFVFWTCLGLLFFLGLWRGMSEKLFLAPALLLLFFYPILYALEMAALPLSPMRELNHSLCVYLAYPAIVLGPFLWVAYLSRTPLVKKIASAAGVMIVAAISLQNIPVHRDYRMRLLSTGGAANCSAVVKDLVRYAEKAGIHTIAASRSFAPATIPFYSGRRIAVRVVHSQEEMERLARSLPPGTGFFSDFDTDEPGRDIVIGDMLRRLPGLQEYIFRRPDGQPIFALHIPARPTAS